MVSILVVNPVKGYLLELLIAPCMHVVLVPDPGMEGRGFGTNPITYCLYSNREWITS